MCKQKTIRSIYTAAKSHDLYKLSCGSFALYAILALTLKRQEIITQYGYSALCFAACGIPQTIFSYLGDVVFLGQSFLPDIIFAISMITWACYLYRDNFAFWLSFGFAGIAFFFSLYFNHMQNSKHWVRFHIAWHTLPIIMYTTTTSATMLDRIILFQTIWSALAYHFGVKSWHERKIHHFTHIIFVFGAILLIYPQHQIPHHFSSFFTTTIAFSFTYFFTDFLLLYNKKPKVDDDDYLRLAHSFASAIALLSICHHRLNFFALPTLLLDSTISVFAHFVFNNSNQPSCHFIHRRRLLFLLRCLLLPLNLVVIFLI
uniref:Uncharacterized protein n=1 Tax=Aureoumbra lagunensis TaxID=44058 RepID=A0A7S3K681_9STRA